MWRIVAPNPSPLTVPGTNTYVVGRERRVVIDPGCSDPVHLGRVLEVAGGAVERILCTHSHPDHSPGAAWLRERTGAPVLGLPAPDDGHQDVTYAPDAAIADGERFAADDAVLRAIHTPGHGSNHVCFLLEEAQLLFTGDHLMSGSTVIIIPPDGSMRLYLESLRRLRELSVATLAPGHGALMPVAIGEIDRVIGHRLAREAKLARALDARRVASLDAVLPEVYDDVPKFMHRYARYSLLAHAAKLVEDGRAEFAPLPVSAPFHCVLMKPAEEKLAPFLDATPFSPPAFPVVTNVDASPNLDPAAAREALDVYRCTHGFPRQCFATGKEWRPQAFSDG